MSDNASGVPENIYQYEGRSVGGESQTTDGSSLKTIEDRVGSVEPIELGRGLCRVIFSYGRGRPRVEVVCAGQYGKCGRPGHKEVQKDESKRGSSGWYIGVYSRVSKLVGGHHGTLMDAESAKNMMEARRAANRKVAMTRGSTPKVVGVPPGGKRLDVETPESGAGTSWVDPMTGKPIGASFQAVGDALISEVEKPRTIEKVTERVMNAQRSLTRNEGVFAVGTSVGFRQGKRIVTGRVLEVYPGELPGEEPYYYVARDDKGEIQIGEGNLYETQPRGDARPSTRRPTENKAKLKPIETAS